MSRRSGRRSEPGRRRNAALCFPSLVVSAPRALVSGRMPAVSNIVANRRKTRTRSAFQAHVSTYAADASNVIDLSERKLVRMAAEHRDEDARKLAAKLLRDYVDGTIAVAWEDGIVPVYSFLRTR